MTNFKIALVQLLVGKDKAANVLRAVSKITEAAKNGASLVILPEFFNSPYGNQYFKEYAEPVPGPTTAKLSEVAKELKIDLIGGTLPEEHEGKLFNTCPIFNKTGSMIAKFRKMHLFDIDVPGKITFKESEMLSPGNQPVIFENDLCKTGIGICYDVRFSELAHLYALNGCSLLVYPAAFNMTTGPPHWELMARSRAVQTQCYVALCSPARDSNASYVAWGHSLVVDPWGKVIASSDEKETILYADIDLVKLEEIRTMIPIWKQRRTDIYSTECLVNPLNVH